MEVEQITNLVPKSILLMIEKSDHASEKISERLKGGFSE